MFRRNRPRPIFAPKVRVSKGEVLSVWERYFERALHQYQMGEFDEALLDVEAAIEANQRYAELYALRGMIFLEQGKTAEALEDFEKTLKMDQRQWAVHYLMGVHEYRSKNIDKALTAFATAQQYAPARSEVLYMLGMCYYRRGELERAKDFVQAAVDNADDPKAKSVREMKKFLTQVKRDVKAAKKS